VDVTGLIVVFFEEIEVEIDLVGEPPVELTSIST
jgi:hypothetical protein